MNWFHRRYGFVTGPFTPAAPPLLRDGSLPPIEMIARIMQAADAFANGAPQHYDMTLVVARVLAG